MRIKSWISAFRLRTLPLALASIGMGSFLAAASGYFRWEVFILCAATTICLQVLSNLANDYGDSIHGADSHERSGPGRMVQTGAITAQSMKYAMVVFVLLSLGCGISLLYVSFGFNRQVFLFFLILGILAIFAAMAYTAGKRPYGYMGLGDISVLLFFGFVGVLGSYYLYAQSVSWYYALPATSCGFFATAVLNVNNIRDIDSDRKAGKFSIPVRIGRENAIIYHWFLLFGGLVTSLVYVGLHYRSPWQLLFIAVTPLLFKNARAVYVKQDAVALDPYLKQMALTTLLFVCLFGIGNLLS